MENLLEIRDLKITTLRGKQSVYLLDKVSLDIRKKCSFGIVGGAAAGKASRQTRCWGSCRTPFG